MTFKEACYRVMTEWSISRAYKEFQASKTTSFAILTSWRSEVNGKPVPAEVNNSNWSAFKSSAGSAGHGYVELVGYELKGGQNITEPSLWVNGISLSRAESLAAQYNQDGFIYAGPETNGDLTLYWHGSGTVKKKFSPTEPLSADDINRFWSEWRGRPFRFIEWLHPVQNSVEGQCYVAMIENRARQIMLEDCYRDEPGPDPFGRMKYD